MAKEQEVNEDDVQEMREDFRSLPQILEMIRSRVATNSPLKPKLDTIIETFDDITDQEIDEMISIMHSLDESDIPESLKE